MASEQSKEPQPVRQRILVSGRVQGVGFRYATVEAGRRLGLRGWARNTLEGRVEIVAEGPVERVRELVEWCRRGPPSARVTAVDHVGLPLEGECLEGFQVRG